MDNKVFKNVIKKMLLQFEFNYYKNNTYYYGNEDSIIVINIQKSQWSNNDYYINYGMLFKNLHNDLNNPYIADCDITARFYCETNGEKSFVYNIEILNEKLLEEIIRKNMIETIEPIKEGGIKKYFEIYPQAICTIKLKLKNYLGL